MPCADCNLTHNQFAAAFPFHFVLNHELRVQQTGAVLHRICPGFVEGVRLSDEFEIERPILTAIDFQHIQQDSDAMFLMKHRHSSLRLRGEVIIQEKLLFFLGSPWVTELSDVAQLGLTLRDFAIHDPITDLLFLIQSKNKAVADAQKFARVLKNARDEISAINQSLEKRVAERTAQLETANRELLRSNKELETFAYVASHDLQEPLRSVAGFVQLLQERYKGKLDADADRYVDFAVGGTVRMHQLIKDLLTYSRVGMDDQSRASSNTQALVERAISSLKSACDENNAVITVGELPAVTANAAQLGQVFQNLISNAIKYRSEARPEIQISAEKKDGFWVFCVHDNGIGIDPKYHEKIFVIFQRLHGRDERPGAGLGLAICKKVVERHGGSIWVESAPGKGAAFYFTIPDKEAENK
jgi:signal transduction histidine kinase